MIELLGRSLAAIFAGAAFLLPGWLIARWQRAPWPILTSFLASAALWFHVIILADAAHIPLRRVPLLAIWTVITVITAVLAWRRQPPARPLCGPAGLEWLWVACAGCAAVSIAARSVFDPLSGWDNLFRWDYLARAMLAEGHLQFYPPVESADFEIYAWSDGIPPLASFLNSWFYLVTGVSAPEIVAARVMAEGGLAGAAVFVLGRALWGPRGGWPAVGLAATSALLLWGIAQAQEVGLLTIAVATMLAGLAQARSHGAASFATWAGVAAALASLSREYGLLFPLLGGAVLAVPRSTRRLLPAFALPAVVLSAGWYLRNALHTGNPVYPQSLGGLFAGNPYFNDVMARIGEYWRLDGPNIRVGLLAGTLLVLAGAVLAAGMAGLWRDRRGGLAPFLSIAVTVGLWLWSVRMTAGGLNYSLRVLTPAVAVLAALGGVVSQLPRRRELACAVIALLCALDAGRRAWLLPVDPLTAPLPYTWAPWKDVRDTIEHGRALPLWSSLVARASGSIVAVDSPGAHAEVTLRGGRSAMLFSPIFEPCFNSNLSPAEVVSQLRMAQVRLIMLHVGDPVARGILARHAFFEHLVTGHRPVLEGRGYAIYDLADFQPAAP